MASLIADAFPDAKILATTRLSGGKKNHGVYLHTVARRFRRAQIVEKVTSQAPEIATASAIRLAKVTGIFPAVRAILPRKRKAHLFMDYVPGVGTLRGPEQRAVRPLCDALIHLRNLHLDCDFRSIEQSSDLVRMKIEGAGLGAVEATAALQAANDVRAECQRLDYIICHGDLHWKNIGFRRGLMGPRLTLIDFGGLSKGPAGFDLFIFLRRSLFRDDGKLFFNELMRRYCTKCDLPARSVFAGALLAALQFSLSQLHRAHSRAGRGSTEKWPISVARERRMLDALIARIERL